MSNIQTYLQQILDAVYGEEVRGSIHDAIATMNSDLEAAIRDDLNPLAFKGNLGESGGTNNNLNNLIQTDQRGIWRLLGGTTYTNVPSDFINSKQAYLIMYAFGTSGQTATVIKQEIHYFSDSGANANTSWSRVYLSGEWQPWHKNVDNTLSIEGAAADSKAVGDKLAEFLTKYLSLSGNTNNASVIPAESDLNDYTTPGNYKVSNSQDASTISNMPTDYAGRLTVVGLTGETGNYQIYVSTQSKIFVRLVTGDWKEVATDITRSDYDKIIFYAKALNEEYSFIDFNVIDNEYVDSSTGNFISYNGWNRSDYIPCESGDYLISNLTITNNCAFYNAQKAFISNFTPKPEGVEIPNGAAYFVISGTQIDMQEIALAHNSIFYKLHRDGSLISRIYKNSYVTNTGVISRYNGWNRTDYINVDNLESIKVTSVKSSTYNKFYAADKTPIYTTDGSNTVSIVTGENLVNIPYNAKYIIFSGEGDYAERLLIEPVKTKNDDDIKRLYTNYKADNLRGMFLSLQNSDFTVGKRIRNGVEETYPTAALSGFIPIKNVQNKYAVTCPGFGLYVVQYRAETNGSYTFLSKAGYYTNSSFYWGATNTTHIRFEIYSNLNYVITQDLLKQFCNVFTFRESLDINKYLRVCTFNQAADYPHFTRATEADLNKRILNYLNFIGEYNPDIICAQEALGNYFQPVSFEKSTDNVFNRKYIYKYQGGYQRKTWSKYNYAYEARVEFTHQAEGDLRFYTKQTFFYEDKEIVVINAHCAFQGESDFNLVRKGQFEELAAEMALHEYCICCGDFNAWSADEFNIFSDYNLANCGDYGVIDTWYVDTEYQDWPYKGVDNIITTSNIVIQNVKRGPYDFDYFSDHAPLIADLQIR